MLGDDATYAPRPHPTSPPFPGLDAELDAGDPFDAPRFPLLWAAEERRRAARARSGPAHGTELSCRGWPQEAALRMLMNNLDPDVAERPDDLVVYGGTGRAARSWDAFDAIVRELRGLADDETLLVQSGKPVGVFRTHEWSPRVLIANSNLVGSGRPGTSSAASRRSG